MPLLPAANQTANWDASTAGTLYASDPANIPTGAVSAGGAVGAWRSTVNTNHYWRPNTSGSVFNPPNVTWQPDGLLTLPSLKIAAGCLEAITVGSGAELVTQDFHTASAKTLIFSFLIEDGALLANNATVYLNSVLVGNRKNNYYGTWLRNDLGTLRGYYYNWDGSNDNVPFVLLPATKYIFVGTHDGVNLNVTIISLAGESAQVPVASGATTDIIGGVAAWQLGDSNAAGTEQTKIRVGQITTWNTALTGGLLTDAKTYYVNKWLLGITDVGVGWGASTRVVGRTRGRWQAVPSGLDPARG